MGEYLLPLHTLRKLFAFIYFVESLFSALNYCVWLYSSKGKYPFYFAKILDLVEIHSTYCLYLQNDLNFWINFWNSDQRFRRDIWVYKITCLPRLTCLRTFAPSCLGTLRAFVPYVFLRLTCLRALRSFAPYVPWSLRALITRFSRLICAAYSRAFKCNKVSY